MLYKETSVFFRALSYIPNIPYFNINISGFETYTKIGEDAASLNIRTFREFIEEDIKNKIEELASEILDEEQFLEMKMG